MNEQKQLTKEQYAELFRVLGVSNVYDACIETHRRIFGIQQASIDEIPDYHRKRCNEVLARGEAFAHKFGTGWLWYGEPDAPISARAEFARDIDLSLRCGGERLQCIGDGDEDLAIYKRVPLEVTT